MLGSKKRKGAVWLVNCKMCGRPFPTPLDRETLDDTPDFASYQCPACGEKADYAREDHHPAAA